MQRRGIAGGGGNEQSLEGSVLSIAERQKLHKQACPGKRLMCERTSTHLCTQTHTYTYINTNRKLATEYREKESICMSQVIRVSLICSVMEFAFFWPIGHKHFYKPAIQKMLQKDIQGTWDGLRRCIQVKATITGRTGCISPKYEFPEVCKHTWICPLI